jgi:DNA-binding response OmpR family regulator
MLESPKILIVEDEIHMQNLLQEILTDNRYDVCIANSGATCLKAIKEQSFDLVLLDMHLPDIIGIELFKQIQKLCPDLPCIFVSGEHAETEVVLGLELGAKDYITKPFRAREFLARVKNALKQVPSTVALVQKHSAQLIDQILVKGPLKLNLSRREAFLDDHFLDFTRTEFDLLEMLMRHPHQVLSRKQILDYVWPDDLEINERIIDSHIKHIRSKMRGFNFIFSIRGVGYSFKAPNT